MDGRGGHQRQGYRWFGDKGKVGRATECANWRQKSDDDGDK